MAGETDFWGSSAGKVSASENTDVKHNWKMYLFCFIFD
jgi:hypothetical protein